jgi:hypothetical protein
VANRWLKRGVSAVPSWYVCHLMGQLEAMVQAPQPEDGSVTVLHAGHEMGQGIHIKVIQAAADALDCLRDPDEPGSRQALSSISVADGYTQACSSPHRPHLPIASLPAIALISERPPPDAATASATG